MSKLFRAISGIGAVSAMLLVSSSANAQVFSFHTTAGTGSQLSANSVIDLGGDYLRFETTVKKDSTDSFYLALSPGENPKGHAGELAMLYFDASKSGTPIITTYAYNGVDALDSWYDGNGKIGGTQAPDKVISSLTNNSFVKSTKVVDNGNGTKTLGFEILTTAIQNHNPKYPGSTPWTGLDYGSKYGIWTGSLDIKSRTYGHDGFFSHADMKRTGYIDLHNESTKPVPEPGTMIALGAGALALLRRRRKA